MAAYRAVFTLTAAALTLGLFTAATTVDSNTDDVSCWCDSGIKLEVVDTPFTVPEPPDGARWSLLVIKAGSVQSAETVNYLADAPTVAAAYAHPSGEEISHVILCEEPETPTTPSTTTSTSTTTTTTTSTSTTTTTIAPPAPVSPEHNRGTDHHGGAHDDDGTGGDHHHGDHHHAATARHDSKHCGGPGGAGATPRDGSR